MPPASPDRSADWRRGRTSRSASPARRSRGRSWSAGPSNSRCCSIQLTLPTSTATAFGSFISAGRGTPHRSTITSLPPRGRQFRTRLGIIPLEPAHCASAAPCAATGRASPPAEADWAPRRTEPRPWRNNRLPPPAEHDGGQTDEKQGRIACGGRPDGGRASPAKRRRGLKVNDRARQGSGDAVHLLDLRDHHAAQCVDGVGLGAHDHVVGTGDVLGLQHSRESLRWSRRPLSPCPPRSG